MQKSGWFSVFLLIMFMIPSVQAKERLALVMGNANYQQNKLRNPINDAKAMAKKLRALDFDVIEKHDLNEQKKGLYFLQLIPTTMSKVPPNLYPRL